MMARIKVQRLVWLIFASMCLSVVWFNQSWSRDQQLPDGRQVLKHARQIAEGIEWAPGKIEALQEIARVQAMAGDLSGAALTRKRTLDMLDSMDPPEPKALNQEYWKTYKISLLLDTAVEQARAEDTTGSRRTFKEVLDLTKQIQDPKKRSSILGSLALQQIKIGDRTDGKATVQKILQEIERATHTSGVVRGSDRIELIVRIAETHLEAGDRESAAIAIQQALQEIPSLTRDWEILSAYQDIAVAQAKLGEYAAAMETAQKAFQARDRVHHESPFKTQHFKVKTLIRIADALVNSGNQDPAVSLLKTAQQMTRDLDAGDRTSELRSAALRDIAITAAKLGNIDMALEAMAAITDENYQCVPLPDILEAQIKAGQVERALETADRYSKTERCPKEQLLEDIALARAKVGDVKGALGTVGLTDRSSPDYIRAIAAAKIKGGDLRDVLTWANSFKLPEQRTFALLGIAEGLLKRSKLSPTADVKPLPGGWHQLRS